MHNKNIFITGATGFIGNKLTLDLCANNHVFALVRPDSMKNVEQLKKAGVNIISGDLLDGGAYSAYLDSIDYVFHLAALFKLDAPKEQLYKYNVLGTKRLLEACCNKNIKKIIHFSTAYVMGKKEKQFMDEAEPCPQEFKNLYEWSKKEAEKEVLEHYKKYNLPVMIVRPAIVYGPGSHYGFYDALSLISKRKMFLIPGDGKNMVQLVHVEDVVSAVLHLAELENASGQIYNICGSFSHTSGEIIDFICEKFGISSPKISMPCYMVRFFKSTPLWGLFFRDVPGELLDYFLYSQSYSNSKIRSAGYSFKYDDAFIGLDSTIRWYKNVLS